MKKKAFIAPLIAIGGFLLSPDFYNLLPDKYAHIIGMGAVVLASVMPSLFHKSTSDDTQAQ